MYSYHPILFKTIGGGRLNFNEKNVIALSNAIERDYLELKEDLLKWVKHLVKKYKLTKTLSFLI
jgi:hypothetical protein